MQLEDQMFFEGINWTPSQQTLLDEVAKGNNVCCIGPGGTGKTFVMRQVIEYSRAAGKNVLVVAPTGVSACNIGGVTIHRMLKVPCGILYGIPEQDIPEIKAADIIIMDEISMVRMDMFNFFYLSVILYNPQVQIVVVGDFAQLAPVLTRSEKNEYNMAYCSRYPFRSPMWQHCNFRYVILREVMRQTNFEYVNKLERLRIGDSSVLREFRQNDVADPNAITICCRRETAAAINGFCISQLHYPRSYDALYDCCLYECEMPAEQHIVIAIDARIMFTTNERNGLWQNGSYGTVMEMYDDMIYIRMDDGRIVEVTRTDWPITRTECRPSQYIANRMELVDVRIGTFRQFPLRPAYAITIHKAQGQTFDRVNVSSDSFFDSGQLYVALSRCRSEAGMHITGTLKESDLIIDPAVAEFMYEIKNIAVNR